MKKRFFLALLTSLSVMLLPFIVGEGWAEIDLLKTPVSQVQVQTVLLENLGWTPSPKLAGVESASALGNLSDSALYVLFGKMNGGAIFPAHTHPDARITTVISGVMYYGVGEQFDRMNTQLYPAGSVIYTPAGIPHFMWVKEGEAVMQETGSGPTGIKFMKK